MARLAARVTTRLVVAASPAVAVVMVAMVAAAEVAAAEVVVEREVARH